MELQRHEQWPQAEARRTLPGGTVQYDTCLSATKAFHYFQTSQPKRDTNHIVHISTDKIQKPQNITAQEKYRVVY